MSTGGGILLTASGEGAPAGVPLVTEGLAQLTYEVFVTVKSASSLSADMMTLSKLNSEESPSGKATGSGETEGTGNIPTIDKDLLTQNAQSAYDKYEKSGWQGTVPGQIPGLLPEPNGQIGKGNSQR